MTLPFQVGRINAVLALYVMLAAFGAVLAVIHQPLLNGPLWLAGMMVGLGLIAEFMPVVITRRGIRMTFNLPFVVGMSAVFGPVAAILCDVLVTVIGMAIDGAKSKRRIRWIWMSVNGAIAAISCSAGGLCQWKLVEHFNDNNTGQVLGAIAFSAVYSLANFVLVTFLDGVASGRRFGDHALSNIRLGSQGILMYVLVSVAVVILVRSPYPFFAPLTLVPVWALRDAMLVKTQLAEHYFETITALSLMLQRAHPYTHGHLERVSRMAEEVALKLGISPRKARLVRTASVLHDIGKIALDETVLDAPRKLTESEFEHVKLHAAYGAEILSHIEGLRTVVPWICYHHERPDGRGYPAGLSDVEIPIESKIIAVVDAFDAMTGGDLGTEKRPYRDPVSPMEAMAELERCSGKQFDPTVVRAFREILVGGAA